jgi:hypothetical protein
LLPCRASRRWQRRPFRKRACFRLRLLRAPLGEHVALGEARITFRYGASLP